jgi:hypothetical protein
MLSSEQLGIVGTLQAFILELLRSSLGVMVSSYPHIEPFRGFTQLLRRNVVMVYWNIPNLNIRVLTFHDYMPYSFVYNLTH